MNTKFDSARATLSFIGVGGVQLSVGPGHSVAPPGELALACKRACDIAASIIAIPFIVVAGVFLAVLNPVWNPGPLLYRQTRMGKDCKPFTAIKFRSMRCAGGQSRGPGDPVEKHRITPLGRFLRRNRIDELPQFFNIIRGEMSLIGPRPDFWEHAVHFVDSVPGYRERHVVKPGLTGLAQVHLGYAEGVEATFRKVRHDLDYIRRMRPSLELAILWRTVVVVTTGFGAR